MEWGGGGGGGKGGGGDGMGPLSSRKLTTKNH